jgi:hypothetical protein
MFLFPGSNLIEYGPSNQSVLIGTNIRMPCKIADEVLTERHVKPEWSKNVSLIESRLFVCSLVRAHLGMSRKPIKPRAKVNKEWTTKNDRWKSNENFARSVEI